MHSERDTPTPSAEALDVIEYQLTVAEKSLVIRALIGCLLTPPLLFLANTGILGSLVTIPV
ncbi:hypothetical protein Q31a_10710 [Aureliella helgolandensis]|uniref:Uncharacterized protein n=1 Tax=Aureliella helgolandensis TaxID=2527968 RepID=A0A518G2J0_9BACT|nr:hypothetical protein Q31a_10710 [Aureliella helgolandensis]